MCGICPAGCGLRITLDKGRIGRVAPWKEHPLGICCPRGARSAEIVYSPDRLLHPLRRTGERGEGEFERISWDQALNTIADQFQDIAKHHGPEALCIHTGRGTFEQSLCDLLTPSDVPVSSAWNLLFPFGSPNTTGVGSICYVSHGVIAPNTTFGVWGEDISPDIENSDLIVVWGSNPATDSSPVDFPRVIKARKRGVTVIVIDHQRTQTARATQAQWLGIRPGTDGALALSMIQVLIDEALYDHAFVETWTTGFAALKIYVAQFTPEQVEKITFIKADEIRETARAIARAQGAALLSYTGLEYTSSATQNIRAIYILWAITGNLDVPGGNVIKSKAKFQMNQSWRVLPPDSIEPIGKSKYPLYHLYRKEAHAMELPQAILNGDPYPLRGMLVAGSSIITAYPDPQLWRRSLAALDFLVVTDRFLTADAKYADIILPATTMFENETYVVHGQFVQLRQQIITPRGEAKSDWDIAIAIANRMGYGDLYPQSSEEMLRWALAGTGIDLETLRAHPEGIEIPGPRQQYRKWELGLLRDDGQAGFATPSGKFEITSSVLAEYGYDALPVYVEPLEGPIASPEIARKYPLVFNSGARIQSNFRSQHHNIPSLLKMQPHPQVLLHPRDAGPRNIQTGDAVLIVSPRGKVRYHALVTEDIVPGVIEANAGGGSPIATDPWRQCNVNELTDFDNRDPISGFPVYKALLCDVIKSGDAWASGGSFSDAS
ncbi:MAG TPA: dehydrogenase [Gammaproteobacteria bacterium]|nr:dehydrogenase [Gammaproteobacteria bacterium]